MSMLDEVERRALLAALDDEYKAWATYDQVLADFGEVRPFSHIRGAEARHIEALRSLCAHHRVKVPPNPWVGRVPRYASVRAACEAAVQAEIDNDALYERLKASTQREDLLRVFDNLQRASRERHLPAFRRCAERGGGGARGGGFGRGGGGRGGCGGRGAPRSG